MRLRNEHDRLVASVPGALAEILGVPREEIVPMVDDGLRQGNAPDLVVQWGRHTFVLEFKLSGATGPVAFAVEQVRKSVRALGLDAVPVVAVPFMGDVGRRLCEDAGVGWLDLSGNGAIVAKGLRVRVEGRPNRHRRPGRPADVFAPKSSRLVRWLLTHPEKRWTQRAIAQATAMDEGHLSRLVARLEEKQLLVRDDAGAIRGRDPNLLLDAWREAYSFEKHHLMKGHVPARTTDALLRELDSRLSRFGVKHAATGLSAAWLISHFAGFRTVTMYLDHANPDELLGDLGWRQEERGANVWLAVPNDEGVFQGSSEFDGVQCVHPVQVYLDLKGHPERAPEAAERLRADVLTWETPHGENE